MPRVRFKMMKMGRKTKLYSRTKTSSKNHSKFSFVEHPETKRKVYFFSFINMSRMGLDKTASIFSRLSYKKCRIIMTLVIICMPIGIISGAIGGIMSGKNVGTIGYRQEYGFVSAVSEDVLRESLLKHGKIAVIIWLMVFVPAGWLFAAGIIFFRGYAYGFAASLLARISIYAVLPYLPQAVILIPAYLYMTYRCIDFISNNSYGDDSRLIDYFSALFIGCVCSAAASVADAYIVPAIAIRFA